MSDNQLSNSDPLLELLADRALFGLDATDEQELQSLDLNQQHSDVGEYNSFEQIVAVYAVAATQSRDQELPQGLATRLKADVIARAASERGMKIVEQENGNDHATGTLRTEKSSLAFLPWLIAAAGIALAVIAWWPSSNQPDAPASLAAQFDQLQSSNTVRDLVSSDGETVGQIVWDNDMQQGVMRFDALAANDPEVIQYQLWIFDRSRDLTGHPAVDGGVFDIETEGDSAYVAIDAKLKVGDPYLFAITTEPPGGVVEHVDTEDHQIILTAPVS